MHRRVTDPRFAVPGKILIAIVAKLRLYGFWRDKGLFPTFCGRKKRIILSAFPEAGCDEQCSIDH